MRTLNPAQTKWLTVAGAVALLMLLFPPWQTFYLDDAGQEMPEFFRYAAVFARPTYHAADGSPMAVKVQVYWGLLVTQLCALGVCAFAGAVLLRTSPGAQPDRDKAEA